MKHKTILTVLLVSLITLSSTVAIAQQPTIFKDFEDQTIQKDGWSIIDSSNAGSITDNNPLVGEYSLQISSTANDFYYQKNSGIVSPSRVATYMQYDGGTTTQRVFWQIQGPNGLITRVQPEDEDNQLIIDHAGGRDEISISDIGSNTMTIEIYDIDWGANTFHVAYNNTDNSVDRRELGPYTFVNANDGFDRFGYNAVAVFSYKGDQIEFNGELYEDQPPPGEFTVERPDNPDAMRNGETLTYETSFNLSGETTDVTNETTVTSNNTDLVTVDQSTHELIANDSGGVGSTNVTFQYGEFAPVNITIFVGPRTITNIGSLPPNEWVAAVMGFDEEGTWYVMGSEIQMVLLAVFIGAATAWKARNEYLGIGVIILAIILFWMADHVSLGIVMVSVFYGLFAAYQQRETPGRSDTNVNPNGGVNPERFRR